MITQTEKDLIMLLKSCGLDKETTVSISILCETDENREKMIQEIIRLYKKNGEVSEQQIQMIGLSLTGIRKSEPSDLPSPSGSETAQSNQMPSPEGEGVSREADG